MKKPRVAEGVYPLCRSGRAMKQGFVGGELLASEKRVGAGGGLLEAESGQHRDEHHDRYGIDVAQHELVVSALAVGEEDPVVSIGNGIRTSDLHRPFRAEVDDVTGLESRGLFVEEGGAEKHEKLQGAGSRYKRQSLQRTREYKGNNLDCQCLQAFPSTWWRGRD